MRLDKGPLKGSFQGSRKTVRSQQHSARQSRIGYKRALDIAGPAHLGALIAAKPRILARTQGAVTAGPLPKQLHETRLATIIDIATTTYLEALGDEDKATAKLYVLEKAALAADDAWQQTVEGAQQGPAVTNPTVSEIEHSSSASPDDDKDDMDFRPAPRRTRLSAPQLQAAFTVN